LQPNTLHCLVPLTRSSVCQPAYDEVPQAPKSRQLACWLTMSRNLSNVGVGMLAPEPRLKPNVTVRVWTDVIIEFLGRSGLDFRAVQFSDLQQGRCEPRTRSGRRQEHRACWRFENWAHENQGPADRGHPFSDNEMNSMIRGTMLTILLLTVTNGLSWGSGVCILILGRSGFDFHAVQF
jgi:hypothetical protein